VSLTPDERDALMAQIHAMNDYNRATLASMRAERIASQLERGARDADDAARASFVDLLGALTDAVAVVSTIVARADVGLADDRAVLSNAVSRADAHFAALTRGRTP
jgi:hypothetical protein